MIGATAPILNHDAGLRAQDHKKAWERALTLRIAVQKGVELANKLPVIDISLLSSSFTEVSDELRRDLAESLQLLASSVTLECCHESDHLWDQIIGPQQLLEKSWSSSLNRWYARFRFGSEQASSKMKVFNRTFWEQVEDTIEDSQKLMKKTRMPMLESARLGKRSFDEMTSNDTAVNGFDEEVYDDRDFYSHLLKTYIATARNDQRTDHRDSLSAVDLGELRKYKRRNLHVDRRASKGRKIRYITHPKLQNFKFPVQRIENNHSDSQKLLESLFQ